ncbi:hypothetical protein HELRODRAFT_189327 [Helobdella robusta]|uniref:Uncharacterized protein n=1 Tax=Helobdella robusta TaxID=6412 RepID=T1FQY6_HELRO|nr:hypothetical protein HELRODRAFT_189327 [Helobdella robusta]ESN96655.1 hypothetical protein HELRODRAFT_189327 [Helobdella robusta]
MPSQNACIPSVHPNNDGSVSIRHVPTLEGAHEISLSHNDQPVEGTPVRINVGEIGGAYATAYGPGLVQGRSGQKTFFRVVKAKKLDEVAIKINGPEKAEINEKTKEDGLYVEYIPFTPGEYFIDVVVDGSHIHGSPFSAKISGQGTKKTSHIISTPSEYNLCDNAVDLTGLIAYLKGPAIAMTQIPLKIQQDGQLAITGFSAREAGTYVVDVSREGHKFKGSPFKIEVTKLTDPSKVKVKGALKKGKSNCWNQVTVDIGEAGYGELYVSMEGPFRTDFESQCVSSSEYLINYRPPEPGRYLMVIKYAGEHVETCPFLVNIEGESSGRVRSQISTHVQSPTVVLVGKTEELNFAMPGCSALDMEASLTQPSGGVELCEIRDQPGSQFIVKVCPVEKGLNILSLKMKGVHISGSPLPFTVGSPINDGDLHKVEFGGIGADRGVVNTRNTFNVYTREAGSGMLQVTVDGPSEAQLEIKDTKTGFCHVTYKVEKEGEYTIGLKYDGVHIPRSPFKVLVDPDCKDAHKVSVHAMRDRGLEVVLLTVSKPCTFSVNLNGAEGLLKGHLTTPSCQKKEIILEDIGAGHQMVRFVPDENGVYYVSLKFNNTHIPGSPFPMLVGQLGADPAMVKMEGRGLISGTAGQLTKFYVITSKAGIGPLQVQVEGPSRVAISCNDTDDGYEFSYTPTYPGDYYVTTKFCNVIVPGCPYKTKIGGIGRTIDAKETSTIQVQAQEKKPGATRKTLRGDSSKVIVQGPGLKKGFISRVGTFTLDFKEAGNALLVVAMVSPQGLPVKELTCKKQKPGQYVCTYLPESKGDHQLHIRWDSDDVPGSPFVIPIA